MAYDELTVVELKDMLRERGLPVSGRKSELVARLTDADEAPSEAEQEEAPPENAPDIIDEGDDFEEDDDDYFEEEGDFEEWDDFHTSRQKPVLDDATRAALDMRAAQSKPGPPP